MPHLTHIALTSADPDKRAYHDLDAPWVRAVHAATIETVYWPTLRRRRIGGQTVRCCSTPKEIGTHLETFTELPDGIVFIDRSDCRKAYQVCTASSASGGVPNTLLSMGTPQEVGLLQAPH